MSFVGAEDEPTSSLPTRSSTTDEVFREVEMGGTHSVHATCGRIQINELSILRRRPSRASTGEARRSTRISPIVQTRTSKTFNPK